MSNPQTLMKGLQRFQQAQQQHARGELALAAESYRQALLLLPNHVAILAEYARLAEQVHDWQAAEKLYRQIMGLRPDAGVEAQLGYALFKQTRFAEAAPFFHAHLKRQPDDSGVLLALGLVSCALKNWQDALVCGRRLESVAPDAKSMEIVLNSLFNLGCGEELDTLVEIAIRHHPDNPDVLSLCGVHLLKRGAFRRGFAFQRAIRHRYDHDHPDFRTPPAHWWDGKRFNGTLLVSGEQGLGEEILASCMFRDLIAMGQHTLVECEPRLIPIFRRSFPEIDFLPRWEGHFDRIAASGIVFRRIKSLDLACFLRRNDQLPPQAPWLLPDAERVTRIRQDYQSRWPGRQLVGLSWHSSRTFSSAMGKSMPVLALAPLLARQNTVFINVQYGDRSEDLAALARAGLPIPVTDDSIDAYQDLDGLLAQLGALNSVISVSNTTVHLAGASGVPCHVLLPQAHPVFWYWGYDAQRTPWYPSLRFWRNGSDNDWTALATRIGDTVLMPDNENEHTLTTLVDIAWEARDWAAAERILRRADTLYAGRHRARLALAVFNQQRHADALPLLESLAESGQLDISCALALASCVEHTGDEDRAVRIMRSIYDAIPTDHYAVLLASALLRLGRRGELDTWLPELVAAFPANPQLQAARSEHAFLRGDYATGFDSMTHRWSVTAELPKHSALPCPEWDGIRRDSLLLVTAEQGLGDEILSSSMFEDLVRMGQPALIDCEPRLLPVFSRSFPALRFVDRHGTALIEAASTPGVHKVAALELGRFFRRDSTALPTRASWLLADPARTCALRAMLQNALPGKKLVGLSWRSHRHLIGNSKSIPLLDLEPLLREPDCAFINLQYGNCSADFAQLRDASGLALYTASGIDNTHDIDGLFALVAALDGVVTSSNTTAHIAGALGKPTWLMIPGSRYVLWYWGHEGDRTPWYPSVRLFRGPPHRDWRALAGDVAADLARTPATAP